MGTASEVGLVPVKAHQPADSLGQGSCEAVKAGGDPGSRGWVQQLEGGPVAGEAGCRGEAGSAARAHCLFPLGDIETGPFPPSPTLPCPEHHRTPALPPPGS